MFFSKGSTMIYAGQEKCDNNLPSLFDIDKVNWDGEDITKIITKLATITKDKLFSNGNYEIKFVDKDVFVGEYSYLGERVIGIFNVGLETGSIDVDLHDGIYNNLITGCEIAISEGKLELIKKPIIFKVEY